MNDWTGISLIIGDERWVEVNVYINVNMGVGENILIGVNI